MVFGTLMRSGRNCEKTSQLMVWCKDAFLHARSLPGLSLPRHFAGFAFARHVVVDKRSYKLLKTRNRRQFCATQIGPSNHIDWLTSNSARRPW